VQIWEKRKLNKREEGNPTVEVGRKITPER